MGTTGIHAWERLRQTLPRAEQLVDEPRISRLKAGVVQNTVKQKQIVAHMRKKSSGEGRVRGILDFFAQHREDAAALQQIDACYESVRKHPERAKRVGKFEKISEKCDLSQLKSAKKMTELEADKGNIHASKVTREFLAKELHEIGYTMRDVKEYHYTATHKALFIGMKDGTQLLWGQSFLPEKFESKFVESGIYNARKELLESIPEIKELEKIGNKLVESRR